MEEYENMLVGLQEIDARKGMPEEVFLAISTVIPIPNVDLLIRDAYGRILLSWRDDMYFGKGWHIPGGCIRFKESMEERVQETAISELQTKVNINPVPLAVRDVIVGKNEQEPRIRAHHLAVLFECGLPEHYSIDHQEKAENDVGFLKWFSKIPDNILKVHDCYNDIFERMGLM